MNKLLSILVFLTIFLGSCKKGDKPGDGKKVLSEIKTSSIQLPDPTRLIISGNIKKGDYKITDYGVIYGDKQDLNKKNGKVVSLGSTFGGGDFSKEITNLEMGEGSVPIIYARAYLEDENGTLYGNELSTERPVFESGVISPLYGKTEDQVTITGKFYSPAKADIQVTFSNVSASVLSVSDNQIVVTVPKGIPEIHGQRIVVSVINKGVKTEMTKDFEILAHITDFSPKEGAIGSLVSFEGDNLQIGRWAPVDVPIYFGDVQAAFNFFGDFHVEVPMDVPFEKMPIYVSIKGVKTRLPGEFKLLKPIITDINPKSASPGTDYKVTGKNLPLVSSALPVQPLGTLGGKTMNMTIYYPYELTFKTPLDIDGGEKIFTLKAGPFTVSSTQKVTVLPFKIPNMQPKTGYFGTKVVLTGTFVIGNLYDLYINGTVYKEQYAEKDGEMRFSLPTDVVEGDADVGIQIGAKKISAGTFKVLYPKIVSISPVVTKAGARIIINGVGSSFTFDYSTPDVYFGDVKALKSTVRLNDGEVSVIVPDEVKLGKQKIRLVYPYYNLVSPDLVEITK